MKMINSKIKALLILLAYSGIIHASDTLQVAEKKIHINDISWNGIISGDGFGMQYVPSVGFRFGKRTVIYAGSMFSPMNWKNDGYVIGSRYQLIKENESYNGHMILTANFSFEQLNNISLSSSSIKNESLAATALKSNEIPAFKNLRFSGWECAAGFGMNYRFRCGLIFRTEAGFSYANSYQKTFPDIITSRGNQSLNLRLGAGIGWKFGKIMSKQEHESAMIAQEKQEELFADQK